MASIIHTMDGPVHVNRGQVAMSTEEMRRCANFHEVAQKNNWTVQCRACGGAIAGKNNDSQGGVYVVGCNCTEYRCDTNRK